MAGFRDAVLRGQWDEAFEYLTADARRGIVGAIWLSASYASGGNPGLDAANAISDITRRFRANERERNDWQDNELLEFLGELLSWWDRYAPNQLDLVDNLRATEYSEFRITGEFAYAIATLNGRRSQQRFKRIDERWYLA